VSNLVRSTVHPGDRRDDDDVSGDGPRTGPHGPVDGVAEGGGPPRRGHGHDHGAGVAAATRAGARHTRRLWQVFALIAVFLVVEVVAAFATNSLSLLSDAGHMLTDLVGLGMALAAIHVANRGSRRPDRTFGLYRLEILAALANAVLLFGVGLYVLYEAVDRIRDPVEVAGGAMLVVAVLGGLANLVGLMLLRDGAKESLNVKGAHLEVLADLLTSAGVVVAAAVILVTGWEAADPIIAAAIGLFIFPRTLRLAAQAVRVLVQAAPAGLDVGRLDHELGAIPGVIDVHDLHVWTLTSEMDVMSAHLVVADDADAHGVLDTARDLLRDRYGIGHTTLQVEPATHEGCDEITW
jgi:cobalt-zinc-cadmium efflux system protein